MSCAYNKRELLSATFLGTHKSNLVVLHGSRGRRHIKSTLFGFACIRVTYMQAIFLSLYPRTFTSTALTSSNLSSCSEENLIVNKSSHKNTNNLLPCFICGKLGELENIKGHLLKFLYFLNMYFKTLHETPKLGKTVTVSSTGIS